MRTILLLVILYTAGYAFFRTTHAQVWEKDQATYVIFPEGSAGRALYYAWRPLSYLDQQLTGTGAHLGPHR
jgi:hypothetical protein